PPGHRHRCPQVPPPPCLEFYGMLSLRRLFEVLAAQLTHGEAAVLSFLLDEPRDALELLLELERRGLCHEGDLGQLRQLLRLLARHDLLRCVTLKRPRPGEWHLCHLCVTSLCVPCVLSPCPPVPLSLCPSPPPAPPRALGDRHPPARAEYCEHERALRRGVASSRPRGPGRALDVFGQASGVLKARDLGSILCDIKFSELSYLEAFWGDYLSGALLEALKGDVRLLVSVDQDDYEAGRRNVKL
uniref:Uncharacterized protein n=1 Tax=Geospiza parvula TaxID=87175 RepID=A0A8C3NFS0_GEOPR